MKKLFAALLFILSVSNPMLTSLRADTPISIAPFANRELADDIEGDGKGGWSDQGKDNCLAKFPRGAVKFAELDFVIPESGPAAIFMKGDKFPDMPASVSIPANSAKGKCLYVLCAYVWGGKEKAAKLTINYVDGKIQDMEILWDRHISGWWMPKELENSIIAWKGLNGRGVEIGAYLLPVELKYPESPISEIKIQAAKNEGSFVLLGLSVGEKSAKDILPKPILPESWEPDISSWFPIDMKYDNEFPAPWTKSFDFRAPAGSEGFLEAKGEDFVFSESGKPIRFKGACFCGDAFYPTKLIVPHYIHRLKKFGFNQVRFHSLMDVFSGKMTDEAASSKTTVIDEKRLDRFDFFFSELKKAGIYVKASMLFSHRWGPETGVLQWDKIDSLNNTQYFYDEKHQELYLEFLRKFFTHKNPYTGTTYAEDPAFCMFKAVNECSMFFNTADAVPPAYRIKLQDKWNLWLKEKYSDDSGIYRAWKIEGEASPIDIRVENLGQMTYALRGISEMANCSTKDIRRIEDQTRFYLELETKWFGRVESELRKLGSKVLFQGSSWGGPGFLQELQTAANAKFDFCGKHSYWLHPHGGWTPKVVSFLNLPVTKYPEDNFFNFIYQHPSGKPFTCTEWNFCWPNDYTVEAAAFMAAYGAMQNLAANHRFVAGEMDYPGFLNSIFGMYGNPATMVSEPFAYFMYVRGDIKTAPLIYRQALDKAGLHDPLRKRKNLSKESENRFYMKFGGLSVPSDACFIGKVELSLDPEKYPEAWDQKQYDLCHDKTLKTLKCVTGELLWNYGDGFIDIMSPKSRGVIGFFSGRKHDLAGLSMELDKAYGVAYACSLDDKPLEASSDILIGLATRTRNKGQLYSKLGEEFSLANQGDAPILMEPSSATISLETKCPEWTLEVLDCNGVPMDGKSRKIKSSKGKLDFSISNKEDFAYFYHLKAAGAEAP